ncbi:hypothetical protein MMC16_007077 [Acarospora aff. strigata]|nr:hypothetical protein [Acarospora aff. strigata]
MDYSDTPVSVGAGSSLPHVSVSLSTSSDVLDLSGWPRFALKVTVVADVAQPITVLTRDTILEPGRALWQDRFEFVDTMSNAKVDRATMAICSSKDIRRTWGSEKRFITLQPGVPHAVTHFLSTPTSPTSPGYWDTDINGLERGHTYVLKAAEGHPIRWWSYGTKQELLDTPGESTALTQTLPPLPLNNVRSCSFSVGEVIPKPPRVSVSLSISLHVDDAFENPTLALKVTILSLERRPILALLSDTILDSDVVGTDKLMIKDVGTGEDVLVEVKEGLRDEDQPDRAVILEPDVSFVEEKLFHQDSSQPSKRSSSSMIYSHASNLGLTAFHFKSGHVYQIAIADGQEIKHWRYGIDEDKLDHIHTSNTKDWWECTTIPLNLCAPAQFTVDPPRADQLDIRLTMSASSNVLNLSGTPPFELSLTTTSHEPYPVTLEIVRTLLQPSRGLMQDKFAFVDIESGNEIERRRMEIRMAGMEGARLPEHCFMTLEPGVARTVRTAFTTRTDRFDHTNGLQSGKTYLLRVKDDEPVKWWKGRLNDIAADQGARVGPSGRVRLNCSNELRFTVD